MGEAPDISARSGWSLHACLRRFAGPPYRFLRRRWAGLQRAGIGCPTDPFLWWPLSVYSARALNGALARLGANPLDPQPAEAERDEPGAARVAMHLLQTQPQLRQRFPRALSAGARGAYCAWLCGAGREQMGLSEGAAQNFRGAFALRLADRVRRVYENRVELTESQPLALTPAGSRRFLRWLVRRGKPLHGLRDEEILWFLFECAEDPGSGLAAAYLLQPGWQKRCPHGLTAFGEGRLRRWVGRQYGVGPRWLRDAELPTPDPPLDQLRLYYQATLGLRRLAPSAFRERADTLRLVEHVRRCRPGVARCWPGGWARLRRDVAAGMAEQPGVNVLGHFAMSSGLGEAARTIVEALHDQGVRTSCRNVAAGAPPADPHEQPRLGQELFDVSLLVVVADPITPVCYPRAQLARRPGVYRVGVWYWEMEAAPREWARLAGHVQEVWAPTTFIARALAPVMPVPVVPMMPAVRVGAPARVCRADFGLPDDRYLFLFAFDMGSCMERKNPLGLIAAFREAFRPGERAALAIKVSNSDLDPRNAALLREAADAAGVVLIDEMLSRECTYGLLGLCDAYVSLHRAEGFGMTMAEAMLLGKPTIGTAYSGNLDFMAADNSLLVEYRRVCVGRALPRFPVYRPDAVWAEPSVLDAARCMRWAFEHPGDARLLGQKAQRSVAARFDLGAAGRRMAERLGEIRGKSRRARAA